jgi:hypothetical protein
MGAQKENMSEYALFGRVRPRPRLPRFAKNSEAVVSLILTTAFFILTGLTLLEMESTIHGQIKDMGLKDYYTEKRHVIVFLSEEREASCDTSNRRPTPM